jgi:hypothetical protein
MRTRCVAGIVPWLGTRVTDEKFQVVDELEPLIEAGGGLILDWHTCDAFPERWIDLVVVLQCNHTQLWERLEARFALIPSTAGPTTPLIDLPLQRLSVEKNPGEQRSRDYERYLGRSS